MLSVYNIGPLNTFEGVRVPTDRVQTGAVQTSGPCPSGHWLPEWRLNPIIVLLASSLFSCGTAGSHIVLKSGDDVCKPGKYSITFSSEDCPSASLDMSHGKLGARSPNVCVKIVPTVVGVLVGLFCDDRPQWPP